MDIERKAIICILLILVLPTAMADLPAVSCAGCVNSGDIITDGTDVWRTFYVNERSQINLEGTPDGFWENENGQRVSDTNSLTFVARDNTRYVLNTTNGKFFATINVAKLSSCVPEWRSEIEINGDEYGKDDTRETAAGEELHFSVRVKSGCEKYQVEWSADPPSAVAFNNPQSLSTKGYAAKDYSGKNPTVAVTLTSENGDNRRKQTTKLAIFDNSAPSIEARTDSLIYSYTSFNVYFDGSNSGDSGDNDYIKEIEAWLRDENGIQVSSKRKTISKGQSLPTLKLKPRAMGVYSLTARITDSHGATAEKTITVLVTEKGDSGRDKPLLYVEPIDCVAGKPCDISVRSADKDIFIECLYQGKKMVKPFKFSPGDHEILVKAYYLDENGRRKNVITKTVLVHVVANSNDTVPIVEPASVPIAREDPVETQEVSPGIMPLVAGLFAAALFARRHRNPKS